MTSMTTTTGLAEGLLKQDRLGRVRTPAIRRAELMAEFERTSMSAAEFAGYVGVKYTTFATWLAKARKSGKPKVAPAAEGAPVREAQPVHWVDACVENLESQRATPLTVQLSGGARLEIGDGGQAALAAELLRTLEPNSGRSRALERSTITHLSR